MQREPRSFPRLHVGLVRAAEAGDDRAGTFARLAGLMDRRRSLAIGKAVSTYGLFALAAAALGLHQALLRPGARLVADRLVLALPVVGGLMREILAARFARTLGMLLVNGVPLLAALAIVKDVRGNRAAQTAVEGGTAVGFGRPHRGGWLHTRAAPPSSRRPDRRTRPDRHDDIPSAAARQPRPIRRGAASDPRAVLRCHRG